MNELVSIISPCYNGENFIGRFLESILNQTYDNVEVIIINDGSVDNTEEIIHSYQHRFENRGFKFKYIQQENQGQSEAINKGLEIFQGEYMTWLDSDDYLPPFAIQKKVDFLRTHPEYGTVVCKVQAVYEKTLTPVMVYERIQNKTKDNIFKDLILGRNVFYTPGGYMVRSSMFRDAMPNPLRIHAPREIGQNFQLLLPIVYKYPTGYIDDVCYYYVVREKSHSRTKHTYDEWVHILNISEETLRKVTSGLSNEKDRREEINNLITHRIYKMHLEKVIEYRVYRNCDEYIKKIKATNIKDEYIEILIKRIKSPLYDFFFRLRGKIRQLKSQLTLQKESD